MNKCSTVQMGKNLKAVETLKMLGIDFVAVPVLSESHRVELLLQGLGILEQAANESEAEVRP
jgi:hypothetical protein